MQPNTSILTPSQALVAVIDSGRSLSNFVRADESETTDFVLERRDVLNPNQAPHGSHASHSSHHSHSSHCSSR